MQSMWFTIIAISLLIICSAAASDSKLWWQLGSNTYRWQQQSSYWLEAEETCRQQSANLARIDNWKQNLIVGRMTNCESAWIGRFSLNVQHLTNSSLYSWTQGEGLGSFQQHNFSDVMSHHQPLIFAENLQWRNDLYHAQHPFICSRKTDNDIKEDRGCPSGWYRHGKFCFLQPTFPANFMEAWYFCDGRQATVASVTTESELILMRLLDILLSNSKSSLNFTCTTETWVGLIRITDCNPEFSFSSQNSSDCYQWADRSQEFKNFPTWAPGQPIADPHVRCSVLRAGLLHSAPCYEKFNFVCKKRADYTYPTTTAQPSSTAQTSNTEQTMSTAPAPTTTPQHWLAAVYNFRFGLNNLINSSQYQIVELKGAKHKAGSGLRINGARGSYAAIDADGGGLTQQLQFGKYWSIFLSFVPDSANIDATLLSVNGKQGGSSLNLYKQSTGELRLSLYSNSGYYYRKFSKPIKFQRNSTYDVVVVFEKQSAKIFYNQIDITGNNQIIAPGKFAKSNDFLTIGNSRGANLESFSGLVRCFGVADFAMTQTEMQKAFSTYC